MVDVESQGLTQPVTCASRVSHCATTRWEKAYPWNWMFATVPAGVAPPVEPAGAPGADEVVAAAAPVKEASHAWSGITMETSRRTPDQSTSWYWSDCTSACPVVTWAFSVANCCRPLTWVWMPAFTACCAASLCWALFSRADCRT